MVIPNEPLCHVQKELDMHALRKLPSLGYRQTTVCIQPEVIRQPGRRRGIVIVEAREQPVAKGRARCFADEAGLRRPLATPVLWLSVKERVEEVRFLLG
jgi:hypothetical protein